MLEYEFLCRQELFSFSLLVTLGSEDGSGSTHLWFSLPPCQRPSRASAAMARVSGAPEESRLCSPCTNKASVNDLNFSPRLGAFYKLRVSCHSFSATRTPFVWAEKAALIISFVPPPLLLLLLWSVLSHRSRPFAHLLKRSRDRLIYSQGSALC